MLSLLAKWTGPKVVTIALFCLMLMKKRLSKTLMYNHGAICHRYFVLRNRSNARLCVEKNSQNYTLKGIIRVIQTS